MSGVESPPVFLRAQEAIGVSLYTFLEEVL